MKITRVMPVPVSTGRAFGARNYMFLNVEAECGAIKKFEAVREVVGDVVALLVEVHGRLAPSDGIRIGNAMEQYRSFVYEEPGLGVEIDEEWVKANPWREYAAVWRAGYGYIASMQDTNWS